MVYRSQPAYGRLRRLVAPAHEVSRPAGWPANTIPAQTGRRARYPVGNKQGVYVKPHVPRDQPPGAAGTGRERAVLQSGCSVSLLYLGTHRAGGSNAILQQGHQPGVCRHTQCRI